MLKSKPGVNACSPVKLQQPTCMVVTEKVNINLSLRVYCLYELVDTSLHPSYEAVMANVQGGNECQVNDNENVCEKHPCELHAAMF